MVVFFLGGGGGGGGVSLSSSWHGGGGGVLSSSSSLHVIFVGEETATMANGRERGFFVFRHILSRVYSSFSFISMLRFIDFINVLSVLVCFLYLHHANSAAQECCNLFSSTNDM